MESEQSVKATPLPKTKLELEEELKWLMNRYNSLNTNHEEKLKECEMINKRY
jgi:hypothetical protein